MEPTSNSPVLPADSSATSAPPSPNAANPIATTAPTQTGSDPLLTDKVHPEDLDTRWNSWKCMVCGYVYEGHNALTKCPRCGNEDPDKFDDAS